MLTPAERNSLLLTVGFLLLGGGIKAWKKWRVEIGPFDAAATGAPLRDSARTAAATRTLSPTAPAAPAVHAGDSTAAIPGLSPQAPPPGAVTPLGSSQGVLPGDSLPAEPRKPGRRGKTAPAKSPPACPVDLNAASEAQLADLPGVGPRTAASLAAYRKERGPFRDVRELLAVKGIGEKKLALIAPCLVLSGVAAPPPSARADEERSAGGRPDPAMP